MDTVMVQLQRKARWVARKYPEFKFEDLMQDGMQLITALKRSRGERATTPYLIKAIKYMFSKYIRDSLYKRKLRMMDLTGLAETAMYDDIAAIDERLDRDKFIRSLNSKLANTVRLLMDGYSISEIAAAQKISTRTVYRQIGQIKRSYERWRGSL